MASVDDYIEHVIKKGDDGSQLLARLSAPTLKNSSFVDVLTEGMNGVAVLRIPHGYSVFVHSAGGNPEEKDISKYAASVVDRLVEQARAIGATPIAFADVIDSRTGDPSLLETIATSLVVSANRHKLAIMNGENAILGARVNGGANVSATMISMVPTKDAPAVSGPFGIIMADSTVYAFFDPEGKAVFINSDGVGTKTEFYERARTFHRALGDSAAMKVDDASKLGATVKVIADVVEMKGNIPLEEIERHALAIGQQLRAIYILQGEPVGGRLRGYDDTASSFNISGSVVSIIDEERLRNPPKPGAGDYMIAIRGKPNPRSNGITSKREMMVNLFGGDWHNTQTGKLFLEYLAEPSTILYPVFRDLLDGGAATSVYHMSGGAYNGKLAKPLAKHGLFVELSDLFMPDWRELTLAGASFASAETAYGKWPMGNDGFITTQKPDTAIEVIKAHGLEARKVGRMEEAQMLNGGPRTGVLIRTFNGKEVYFSGK